MTQIESWEMDRIRSLHYKKQLLPQLIDNLTEIRPEVIPRKQQEINKLLSKRHVNLEAFVNFPYDINPWANAVNQLGPWYLWLWPFSSPSTTGSSFPKNDFAVFDASTCIEDTLMSLPWPPDGYRHNKRTAGSSLETAVSGGEQAIRHAHIDPRDKLDRNSWYNDWGEELSDFGVDTELE
ncbi:unnamed protein product [Kluyveromyces dobzhanskii CBS 2104]|uniref:WGS project CCBQ000000000 data, contig 00099 n=1 Tax=Kluyveromyces dobzhanskii CBS 2104 TaxID=1427455 RepID=A0A0A8L4E6_9SACH|nr:unnamed protein product [Kluyveromyces dobzhanskii CBS 2104]